MKRYAKTKQRHCPTFPRRIMGTSQGGVSGFLRSRHKQRPLLLNANVAALSIARLMNANVAALSIARSLVTVAGQRRTYTGLPRFKPRALAWGTPTEPYSTIKLQIL